MAKVLIVEDDSNLRKLLASELAKKNLSVLEAEDGEEAITKTVDEKPEIILLDLLLPKLDGFKVLQRIRQYPDPEISSIHVVVLSNLWSDKDILQAQALKIDHYFVKANTKTEEVVQKVASLKPVAKTA